MTRYPLDGVRILDFSTLVPGPLATLLLSRAGAEVIKVERPGAGDELRGTGVPMHSSSARFALLNAGKKSVVADLKDAADRAAILELAATVDVVVEQFRPGVMERLGLGYAQLKAVKPDIIYCSITGYGQSGPKAQRAGHDLNYLAETGILGLARGGDGTPNLLPILAADIGGGTYPAVLNILLALRLRDQTGEGSHIDVPMADNALMFAYAAWAHGLGGGQWPKPGKESTTGGSPRYGVYAAADGEFLAVACVEDRFWKVFLSVIALDVAPGEDRRDPDGVRHAIQQRLGQRSARDWERAFEGLDACVSRVLSFEEAVASLPTGSPLVRDGEAAMADLPWPLAARFCIQEDRSVPALDPRTISQSDAAD